VRPRMANRLPCRYCFVNAYAVLMTRLCRMGSSAAYGGVNSGEGKAAVEALIGPTTPVAAKGSCCSRLHTPSVIRQL